MAFALSWLLSYVGLSHDIYVRVDFIELNHVRDLDQFVFWELCEEGYRVVDWRLARKCSLRKVSDGWEVLVREGRGVRIFVLSVGYRETWTDEDVELADRDRFPVCERRSLRGKHGS